MIFKIFFTNYLKLLLVRKLFKFLFIIRLSHVFVYIKKKQLKVWVPEIFWFIFIKKITFIFET
jgi:hypothetical protein